ncbi:lysine--tRNA ligase [Candidatus Microgenomates bacterium]|nr:lysine--tRNA ligase [Candidatus Microgenomates bacterium]
MYWADKVADEIINSGKYKPYIVDDMFTPSGFAHLGSLRGPLIHDLIYKAIKYTSAQARFTYVFNDFDVIDGLPDDLQKDFDKYLGFPLRNVPSPEEGFSSFADYFAQDFKNVLGSFGVEAEYLSLDSSEKIQDIYQKVSGSKKRELGWLPFQVICEECGKLGTTRVHDWDGKTIAYTCEPSLVTWAKGCGHTGRISPFGGTGKLPWKVDWPAHWVVIGVTIEGAGKDHSSAGGSRDIARELCREVFKIEEPYNVPYEFMLIGGRKMSSSKGLGLKARDAQKLLPPELARFLFTRTDYRQAVEFDPVGTMTIPDLFDEYDRCWTAYNTGTDQPRPTSERVEAGENLSRTFEMAQINEPPQKTKDLYLPRFRDVVNYVQLPNVDEKEQFSSLARRPLSNLELEILKERIAYAKIWLEKYTPKDMFVGMTAELPNTARELSKQQKEYLKQAITLLEHEDSAEELQQKLYVAAKDMGLSSADAFAAIYTVMLGKSHGPKAGWFLLQYPKEEVVKRLKEAIE